MAYQQPFTATVNTQDQAYWDLLNSQLGVAPTTSLYQPVSTQPLSFGDLSGGPSGSPTTTTTPFNDLSGGPTGSPAIAPPTSDLGTITVNPPPPTMDASSIDFQSGYSPDQVNKTIASIYSMYGQTATPSDLSYWSNYWTQWGSNDPADFKTRLIQGLTGTTPVNTGISGTAPAVDLTGAINNVNVDTSGTDALVAQLTGRANQSLTVNPNDPIVRAQTDSFAAAQERQVRNFLSGVAEKAGPNSNVGAQSLAANEAAAQSDATFTGQVLQSELTARRTEVQNALTELGSILTQRQQLQLQAELAKLDAAISQAQLQQQSYQFDTNSQLVQAGFPAA